MFPVDFAQLQGLVDQDFYSMIEILKTMDSVALTEIILPYPA
jgi:hypothetical protein